MKNKLVIIIALTLTTLNIISYGSHKTPKFVKVNTEVVVLPSSSESANTSLNWTLNFKLFR